MIRIKLFGVGGSVYNQILGYLQQVAQERATRVEIQEINDIDAIMAHNIDCIPSLMVNEIYYNDISKLNMTHLYSLIEEELNRA